MNYINNKLFLVVLSFSLLFGCKSSKGKFCQEVTPASFSSQSIFANVNQDISVVAGSENMLALSCHNCYQNNNSSLLDSLSVIESAIDGGADLIELDITLSLDQNVSFKVSHENNSLGVSFEELLSQPSLINANQLLFIEMKDELATLELVRAFLSILKAHKYSSVKYAYLNENRFVTIRNIDNNNTLGRFRTVLAEREFSDIRPYIKLSRLYYKKTEPQMYQEITTAKQCGFHMVELNYNLGVDVILALNTYAENLGLAVNVFTLEQHNVEEALIELKHDVDILTIEDNSYDREDSIFNHVKQLINDFSIFN